MPSQSPRHTCPLVTTTHRMGAALTNQRQRIPLPIKRSLTGLQNTCLQTAPPGTVHNAAARDDVGNLLLLLLLTLHQPTRFSCRHGRGRPGGGSNRGGRRPWGGGAWKCLMMRFYGKTHQRVWLWQVTMATDVAGAVAKRVQVVLLERGGRLSVDSGWPALHLQLTLENIMFRIIR